MTAQSRSEIIALLARHGLAPSRRLGQHFLADANITRKIVRVANIGPGSKVVEVGAGTGTLTRAMAMEGAHVLAFEIDSGLLPLLGEVTDGLEVEIRHEDVTNLDLSKALAGDRWAMVANLPYNVGTPLVIDALRWAANIDRFVVMVQLEVARRLTAAVGDDDYGLPSIVAGIFAVAEIAFKVPSQVFYPPPTVESAVVVMTRKPAPKHANRAVDLARAGFGQRRKMLRGALTSVLDDPNRALSDAGIDPMARAEALASTDWLRLAAG